MRLQSDFRVSVKHKDGRVQKIELIRQPIGKKFWIRVGGKNTEDRKGVTLSEFFAELRKWFVKK